MSMLAGRVALVTGGSRGIGRGIALELARCGAKLAINHLSHDDEALQAKEEIERQGGQAEIHRADVSDPEAVAAMVRKIEESLGSVGILVNNAGITRDRTLKKMSIAEWDEIMSVNLSSVFHCTREVLKGMRESSWGRIVSISSIVAGTGAFGQANYAAAKAGILGFTRSAALEVARSGITVNAVCPGYIETSMLEAVPEQVRKEVLAKIPVGRYGRPEDVARCVRFLVTEGEYVTGQSLHVNGGLFFQ